MNTNNGDGIPLTVDLIQGLVVLRFRPSKELILGLYPEMYSRKWLQAPRIDCFC